MSVCAEGWSSTWSGNTRISLTTTGLFTQMTRHQKFAATPGTNSTVVLMFSIGRHVKFDACASKFLTPAWKYLPVWKSMIFSDSWPWPCLFAWVEPDNLDQNLWIRIWAIRVMRKNRVRIQMSRVKTCYVVVPQVSIAPEPVGWLGRLCQERGVTFPRLQKGGFHTGRVVSEFLMGASKFWGAGIKFNMTPNGEHQKNGPVHSWPRVKLTRRQLYHDWCTICHTSLLLHGL